MAPIMIDNNPPATPQPMSRLRAVVLPIAEIPKLLNGEIEPLMPDLPRGCKVDSIIVNAAHGLVFLWLSHESFKPVVFKDDAPITLLAVDKEHIARKQEHVTSDG